MTLTLEFITGVLNNHPDWDEDGLTTELVVNTLFNPSEDGADEESDAFQKAKRILSSVKLKDV